MPIFALSACGLSAPQQNRTPVTPEQITTVDELKNFVHLSLCERENLLADQFQTRVFELSQQGNSCGLQFHLQGPRSIKLSAIWASHQNVIYFYDTKGERYGKVRLPNRLIVEPSAA
ncbi:MAG: hypothetical protein R3C02_11025 [Planctomycetaceae bacterium]